MSIEIGVTTTRAPGTLAPIAPEPEEMSFVSTSRADIVRGFGLDVPEGMTLSPAMIMHLLQSRLNDLDAQIGHQMQALEDSSRAGQTMSQAVEALQRARSTMAAEDPEGNTPFNPDSVTIEVDGTTMTLSEVVEQYGLDPLSLDGDGNITGVAFDSYLDAQKGTLRRINSGNEMRMVQMQTLTQQRSQAISMSTQLLRTIADSEKKITDNIR